MRRQTQYFTDEKGKVWEFYDRKQTQISVKCHPREIVLLGVKDQETPAHRKVRAAIAVDVRVGQGYPEIGAARGLLWS